MSLMVISCVEKNVTPSVTLSGIPVDGLLTTRKVFRNVVEGLIAKGTIHDGFKEFRGIATSTLTSQWKNNEVYSRYLPTAPFSVTGVRAMKNL